VDSRPSLIEQFLARYPGRFCVDCMAVALDIPARHVSMARHRLTAAGVLQIERAHCSGCNRARVVVAVATCPAASGDVARPPAPVA
jgi:hypothetical protein